MANQTAAFGFDIGGTHIRSLGLTYKGQTQNTEIQKLPQNYKDLLDYIADFAASNTERQIPIGVGCAGNIDRTGKVQVSPNIRYLQNADLGKDLIQLTGQSVLVENDAAAAAAGEFSFGSFSGLQDFIFLTFGTGIGAGRILDGRLVSGSRGFWGEVGHMKVTDMDFGLCGCGRKGCWEQMASGNALSRWAEEAISKNAAPKLSFMRSSEGEVSGELLAGCLKGSDEKLKAEAQNILNQSVHWIAVGIDNLISICDPAHIFIGGGLAHMGQNLREGIVLELQKFPELESAPEIHIASNLDFGAAMGAAQLALNATEQAPSRK